MSGLTDRARAWAAEDPDPATRAELEELVARAATDGWWSYFTHDPGEMPVRIEPTDKGGYRAG